MKPLTAEKLTILEETTNKPLPFFLWLRSAGFPTYKPVLDTDAWSVDGGIRKQDQPGQRRSGSVD